MSRIDEMIYYLTAAQQQFQHNVGTQQQEIMGKKRFSCTFCGHCPEAEAELLREIKEEFQANHATSQKASPKKGNMA
jgi:hypothetical protein